MYVVHGELLFINMKDVYKIFLERFFLLQETCKQI